ncbi:MAG TPA: class F sortase [Trebonia sp.]|nr:class F sortase [Trebonia sp.]
MAARLLTLAGQSGPANQDAVSLPVPPLAKAATSAGWYRFTAVPGAAGNAVIVGHVDTYTGPGVFYDLYLLRPGDPVYVTADGTQRRFRVTSVRELAKSAFPVNQVFGGTGKHQLWLITCGGGFDYQTGHYLDNIVVSAAWVPPAPSSSHPKKSNVGPRMKVPGKLSASPQKKELRAR